MQYEQTKELFEKLFNNKMSENEAREFLVSLYKQGETSDDIRAAMEVMQEHSIKLDLEDSLRDKIIDVVGTGGDKSHTFNISSTVALLISSIGSIVAKHGNRSITSKSGSADMLEALGIRLDLNLEQSKTLLQECGFTFLFAQNHHPAMKHIMPIRKSLSHRTIFNILGPLTNPARAKKYFLGVYDKEFVPKIAKALFDSKIKSALVFSSYENMDELGLEKPNLIYQIISNTIKDFELSATELGFSKAPKEALLGGDAKENAKITFDILSNNLTGAKRDVVLLNAAGALVADEMARDFKEGLEIATEAINSNKAKKHLQKIIDISQKL